MPDSARDLQSAIADRFWLELEPGRGGVAAGYLPNDVRHGRRVALTVLAAKLDAAGQRGDTILSLREFPPSDALWQQLSRDGVDPRTVGDAQLDLDNERVPDALVVFLSRWCIGAEAGDDFLLANALSGGRARHLRLRPQATLPRVATGRRPSAAKARTCAAPGDPAVLPRGHAWASAPPPEAPGEGRPVDSRGDGG